MIRRGCYLMVVALALMASQVGAFELAAHAFAAAVRKTDCAP